MIKKNNFYLLIFFFIIFSTYNSNEKKNFISIFPIKKIIIEGASVVDSSKLKSELEFLRGTSLFFLKKKKIVKVTDEHDFISSIQLSKKYPNTLKILILENIPVVVQVNGNKKYYLTKDGQKINYTKIKAFEKLPTIFGSYKNFVSLFYELEKINFDISKIRSFYHFEVGRWDITLKDNRTIKLPRVDYEEVLMKIDLTLNDPIFFNYKIFDYRIKNQLILK